MNKNTLNRRYIVDALRRELVGPSPTGKEIDCTVPIKFSSFEDANGPWVQKDTGEEILQRDPPTKRYGIGVLHPFEIREIIADEAPDLAAPGFITLSDEGAGDENSPLKESAARDLENGLERTGRDDTLSDLDLSGSNAYHPSSMGISFLVDMPQNSRLVVKATGGRYDSLPVTVATSQRTWWLRRPVVIAEEFEALELTQHNGRINSAQRLEENTDGLKLQVETFARPNPYGDNPNQRIVTVCLVNRSEIQGRTDAYCLFQAHFEVSIFTTDNLYCILPYPESPLRTQDKEEKSLSLLYRNFDTYAVGHGCAADWGNKDLSRRVATVSAECLPSFETASITPDIKDQDGKPITVSMASLAGLVPDDNGFASLTRVIDLYEDWIKQKYLEIPLLEPRFHETARLHLEQCDRCASRMRAGLRYLAANPVALKAFQLANHAILLQQLHSRREPRATTYNNKTKRFDFSEAYSEPNILNSSGGRGTWRAFQIAFLLMSLQSSCDANAVDRETVELIWFPTGGGKTEAYLGLTAFTLFMRRLINPSDSGVHVLMRYTLRLLTAQQFQRASGLICAMEHLRSLYPNELGTTPYSIGIWVGSANTPNTRADALTVLSALNKGDKYTENKFIISRCPWCGAQMGPVTHPRGTPKEAPKVAGYVRTGETVVFKCPDNSCQFSTGLPIYVIDEDIFVQRPSVVIGTVDKFATLTWKPESRALFGINNDGERVSSPPGLIIQDELHLISGPLGSMVGLYEAVIEELCTDRRVDPPVPPKIVSSTATIRRYAEQICALYGRKDVVLFPPSGLDADDSFFATYAKDDEGKLLPGRLYVGVHAPSLGSLQTVQVRTFTALIQAPIPVPDAEERDPWWTLLIFFNSLRELGTTLSLFQSDIPDYLKVIANRYGLTFAGLRSLWRVRELTGRLRSDEVPEAIADLEVSCTSKSDKKPVDVCLASNILEVGVDIDRLSLMSVVGQPKSTSQYIQVTGRVGRRWWERPGLVVTIYTASKPRDRSHFEKFRTYHERLYAQVEPVSVTPFSPPVLDRALHAVMTMFVRQVGVAAVADRPYPYPAALIDDIKKLLLPRVETIDSAETANFERVFEERAEEWRRWQRTSWGQMSQYQVTQAIPLLRPAGAYATAEQRLLSWSTPTSMRNVDAECEAQITSLYLLQEDSDPEGQ